MFLGDGVGFLDIKEPKAGAGVGQIVDSYERIDTASNWLENCVVHRSQREDLFFNANFWSLLGAISNMNKIIAWLCATVFAATSANAATVSFSFNNALQPSPGSQTGLLGMFDTSLGTLTDVQMRFSGRNTITGSATNSSTSLVSQVTVNVADSLSFHSSLASLDALLVPANPLLSLLATEAFQLAPGETHHFAPADSQSVDWDAALDGILGSFSGAGPGASFQVSCAITTIRAGWSASGGNVSGNASTQAACGAEVIYTYEVRSTGQIPEPASLALVALALAGAGAASRRRMAA